MTQTIIKGNQLVRKYGTKKNPIKALGPVDFEIKQGSYTVILGRSGSGKSTLLNLLSALDTPSSGTLEIMGQKLSDMSQSELSKYRAKVGLIFQQYNLLPYLTTWQNVILGAKVGGLNVSKKAVIELLDKFNLGHRVDSTISVLSGGEQQRVAICRALIRKPSILFCDEPTGALDSKSEKEVQDILNQLHAEGMTLVMVTHNPDFRSFASQIIELNDGLLVKNEMK